MNNKKKHCTEAQKQKVVKDESVCENQCEEINDAEQLQDEVSEVDKMAQELSVWKDKYVRLAAEFDNFRKRTLKEKMELIEYSGEDVIKVMLPVLDDMERATIANEKVDDAEAIKKGMALIFNKMADALKQKGVTQIDAMGKELDTDLHDAIAKVPVEDDDIRGRVIDVAEKGYRFKDKVIRFSKVVVGE